jgi:putative transposase
MPRYRRNYVNGGCCFFTVNLQDRESDLLCRRVNELRLAVRRVKDKKPFTIDAWVVLPNHMHCVWSLPDGDSDYAGRWRGIKTSFSKLVCNRGSASVWQKRYWEHTVRSEEDYSAHVDYVHINPLKHGLVERVVDWPYSSFHRYVANGVYANSWAGGREDRVFGGAGNFD